MALFLALLGIVPRYVWSYTMCLERAIDLKVKQAKTTFRQSEHFYLVIKILNISTRNITSTSRETGAGLARKDYNL